MIQIHDMKDTGQLDHDPLLQREVRGYLCACGMEFDVEDDPDVDFVVLEDEDQTVIAELGEPEETTHIEIHTGNNVRIITRLVFVAAVYFFNGVHKQ